MSSSRTRRNKWLRTPELDWVYYNPYYDLYVLCIETRSKDNDSFIGRDILSADLNKHKIGSTIACGTLLVSFNEKERYDKRMKKYKAKYHNKQLRYTTSSSLNKIIIEEQEANTFYKTYKL